jgi:hypothetical protein
MGDLEGWGQEVINNFTQTQISEAASDRVKRALLTDTASGEQAYTEMRNMIDGDMRIEIEQDIKQSKKADEVDKRLREAEARQARDDAEKAAFDEWAPKVLLGGASAKEIALDPRLDGRSKFALTTALEDKANKTPTPDYGLFNNYFSRIHLPDGHPDKINDWHELIPIQSALGDFSLFEQLRQETERVGTEEGKTNASLQSQALRYADTLTAAIDPMGLFKDPKGEALRYRAVSEILNLWEKGTKAGKQPYELAEEAKKLVDGLRRPMNEAFQDTYNTSTGMNIFGTDAATPGGQATDASPVIPLVSTTADYDKLPVGAQYRKPGDPLTTTRVKK